MPDSAHKERPAVYDVQCSECAFQREIEGLDAIFDRQEEHRRAHGAHHVLEFVMIGAS